MIYCANVKDAQSIESFWPLPGDPKRERGRPLTDEEIKQALLIHGIN